MCGPFEEDENYSFLDEGEGEEIFEPYFDYGDYPDLDYYDGEGIDDDPNPYEGTYSEE
jgi:hypothetical protein